MNRNWSPDSWKTKQASQIPAYPNKAEFEAVVTRLTGQRALTGEDDCARLKKILGDIARGNGFLLQGGDCAESFAEFSAEKITDTVTLMRDMAAIMEQGAQTSVTKVGRMAGQFAKPRSQDMEERGPLALPAYRGDMINGLDFTAPARIPDPARMMRAYEQAAQTMSLIGGDSCCDFYTAHEALMLPYEQALTRRTKGQGYYASSAHFLWIGARTAYPDSAHVEFARGLSNPIGLKCAPDMDEARLLALSALLNPDNEAGRLTLIVRMGFEKIGDHLPRLIRAVEREGHDVVWACDPMHGNTYLSGNGYKTRKFDHVRREVIDFFAIHRAEGTIPAGIHLELTGQNVTECIGGAQNIEEGDLSAHYHTHCDPRLNKAQALELAAQIAGELRAFHQSRADHPIRRANH